MGAMPLTWSHSGVLFAFVDSFQSWHSGSVFQGALEIEFGSTQKLKIMNNCGFLVRENVLVGRQGWNENY